MDAEEFGGSSFSAGGAGGDLKGGMCSVVAAVVEAGAGHRGV